MCYERESLQKKKKKKSLACRRRDQRQVFFSSGVCVASDTFIETKEAPAAVLSVAANSRVSRRRTKDEMFSLSLVSPSQIKIPPQQLLLVHVMLMWPHTSVQYSFCLHSRFQQRKTFSVLLLQNASTLCVNEDRSALDHR